MSRGLRNNNPGNIRHSPQTWRGEVAGTDTAFKTFSSMAYGYRAMFKLINNYQKKYGLSTIREIVTRWAPPIENDTDLYIRFVSDRSGVPESSRITTTNRDVMIPIVAAMSQMENGVAPVTKDVAAGFDLFVSE